MQEQGKQLLLTVVLALGVLLAWSFFTRKDEPPADPKAGSAAVAPKAATPQVGVASGSAVPAAPAIAASAPVVDAPRPAEELVTLSFDNVVATFSSYCGGLKAWKLTDKRYERDGSHGALLPSKLEPERLTMKDAAGKSVPVPASQLANLPDCGAFDTNFVSSTFVIPRHAVWKAEQLSKTEIRYTYTSTALDVVKTFTVLPDQYLVRLAVRVNVRVPEGTEARQQLSVTSYAYQDPAAVKDASSRVAARMWSSATLRNKETVLTDVEQVLVWPRFEPTIQWSGFEHPYLLAGYAPRVAQGEHVEKHTSASDGNDGLPRGFMRTHLFYPAATLKAGASEINREIVGYLGPKNYDDLTHADDAAGFSTGFHSVIDLGWFAFVGRPLLWMLKAFQSVVVNWGVAIILLTVVVKLLTLYWTTKSMRSMKAMAALAPQMKALQTKYADDKQRQQAETMALYKQHNVNPVAGCLPMFLQMPIWLALYRMLSNVGELYLQPFIPGWINDLTAADPYYVLPVLLVIVMFLQARLQPASVDSTQQKFMQYGMPLMFGAFCFGAPAGLTIYMFANTVLGALHSIYMNKFDKKSLAIAEQLKRNQAAAAADVAKPSGLGASASAGKAKAKRVIDAKAVEVTEATASTADSDDDGEDGEPKTGAARNRPGRNKKRRK